MNPTEFLTHCLRTWNAGLTPGKQYLNATEGFIGESGEVADIFKHQEFHPNKALPVAEFHERLIEEAGDVLYYAAVFDKSVVLDDFLNTCLEGFEIDIFESSLNNAAALVGMVMRETGATIEQIMETNVEKLKKRWPDGFNNKLENLEK